MQQKHFLTLDTESTGLGKKAFAFDIGWTVATRRDVLVERRFLVREILTDDSIMLGAVNNGDWRDMMGRKLFHSYIPDLDAGAVRLTDWADIVATLRDDMLTFGVDVFTAYNLPFDSRVIRQTSERLGTGKALEYRPDLLDLWHFACITVCNRPTYHAAADQNGWRSPAGNVRTNAEKTYAYLTGEFDFVESHTALDDARIETEILQRLLAAKKPIPYNQVVHHPWRLAQ